MDYSWKEIVFVMLDWFLFVKIFIIGKFLSLGNVYHWEMSFDWSAFFFMEIETHHIENGTLFWGMIIFLNYIFTYSWADGVRTNYCFLFYSSMTLKKMLMKLGKSWSNSFFGKRFVHYDIAIVIWSSDTCISVRMRCNFYVKIVNFHNCWTYTTVRVRTATVLRYELHN